MADRPDIYDVYRLSETISKLLTVIIFELVQVWSTSNLIYFVEIKKTATASLVKSIKTTRVL